MLKIVANSRQIFATSKVLTRNLSTSQTLLDQHWREDHGLPSNPNTFGPLTNLPDYSYVDGRITPLGTNQKKRIIRQQEIAKKMVQSLKELDYAKKRYAHKQTEKADERKRIIENKLKPKGHLLLKKEDK